MYALVGEAWGAEEEAKSRQTGTPSPFVGQAGQILNSCLAAAGIRRSDCLVTNVFNLRPTGNKLKSIMVPKARGAGGFNALRPGQYLDPLLVPELHRLYGEIRDAKPKIIVALGATALWGLAGTGALGTHRGHFHRWEGIPMIPTYHPARILRQYHLKPSLIGDLAKAREYVEGILPEAPMDYIDEPTLPQIREFFQLARDFGTASVDIETIPAYRAITCIGFGIPFKAICVPFFDKDRVGYSYWKTDTEEVEALELCRAFIGDPGIKKIYHHSVYDVPWLADVLGIETRGETSDTRIMHANIAAELPHDLSNVTATWFLFPAWKALHKSAKDSDSASDSSEE